MADWDRVIELGTELLRTRTKDLQIAAWVAEAVTKRHGFAGLREASGWSRASRTTSGTLTIRSSRTATWIRGPVRSCSSTARCSPAIHSIPLTAGMGGGPYSFLSWQEAKATDNAGLKSPELLEARLADGKINSEILR